MQGRIAVMSLTKVVTKRTQAGMGGTYRFPEYWVYREIDERAL
jgi:hypothetical protein